MKTLMTKNGKLLSTILLIQVFFGLLGMLVLGHNPNPIVRFVYGVSIANNALVLAAVLSLVRDKFREAKSDESN